MKRALAIALLCCLCATVSADSLTAADAKAALLYRLAWYVTWPLPEWTADRPLVIGVVGADPLGLILATLLADKRVNEHPIVVRRMDGEDPLTRCHVLFIAASEDRHLATILARLDGAPVLTVSDLPGFTTRGGMVGLLTVGQRLRFAIQPETLARSGLRMSSHVLQLAQSSAP